MFQTLYIDNCLKINSVCVCNIYTINSLFSFHLINFPRAKSVMCKLATIIIPLLLIAFVAGSVYFYQISTEEKTGHVDEKNNPCENEYKGYCLHGECFYLEDEDIVACKCSRSYGGKRCEKYMWWI